MGDEKNAEKNIFHLLFEIRNYFDGTKIKFRNLIMEYEITDHTIISKLNLYAKDLCDKSEIFTKEIYEILSKQDAEMREKYLI